jgi:hypothetical protein
MNALKQRVRFRIPIALLLYHETLRVREADGRMHNSSDSTTILDVDMIPTIDFNQACRINFADG